MKKVEEPRKNKNEGKDICQELSLMNNVVDKSHIYRLTRKFVRIEYPGLVKNTSKALDTLGGIYNIECTIADPYKKLELKFHPENRFNKSCVSDKDNWPGLVVEVTQKSGNIDYKVIGYTYQNFKFIKAADFQFLPIIQDEKDEAEYVYDKIVPAQLPTLEFLLTKENADLPFFGLPTNFSRYDLAHSSLYVNAKEKFSLEESSRPELFKMYNAKKAKPKYQLRQISYLVNINDPSLECPTKPKELALKMVKEKLLTDMYKQVKKLFDERPMWSKSAIMHRTNITNDMTKIVLPACGYFWTNGPWRMIWTRFGIDPRKDFSQRIYQTLDFRIRSSEGSKIKVKAKRPYGRDSYTQIIRTPKRVAIDESYYILSPEYLPAARQMFYQYCDIRIPEIQDMLQRLPKTLGNLKFDPKNGWLPVNFSDQCREIANRYVMERVKKELIEDSLKSQSKFEESLENDGEEAGSSTDQDNPLSYSSGMLEKMQKGFRRSLNIAESEESAKTVVLTDDEDVDMEDIVESIPATIEENSDSEHLSDDSEYELDMEAVEEINTLISFSKKDDAGE